MFVANDRLIVGGFGPLMAGGARDDLVRLASVMRALLGANGPRRLESVIERTKAGAYESVDELARALLPRRVPMWVALAIVPLFGVVVATSVWRAPASATMRPWPSIRPRIAAPVTSASEAQPVATETPSASVSAAPPGVHFRSAALLFSWSHEGDPYELADKLKPRLVRCATAARCSPATEIDVGVSTSGEPYTKISRGACESASDFDACAVGAIRKVRVETSECTKTTCGFLLKLRFQ